MKALTIELIKSGTKAELTAALLTNNIKSQEDVAKLLGFTRQHINKEMKDNVGLGKDFFKHYKNAKNIAEFKKSKAIKNLTCIDPETGIEITEEWRSHTTHTELKVSSFGRIARIKFKQFGEEIVEYVKLVKLEGTKDYNHITLTKEDRLQWVFPHRLVAEMFVVNTKGEDITVLEVNHKDLDKKNNFYKNLEWVTSQENILHAIANGRHGSFHRKQFGDSFKVISPEGVEYEGTSIKDFCKEHGLTQACMSLLVNGKAKSHKGWTKA